MLNQGKESPLGHKPYILGRNTDGVITHLEPDIVECEVKWALGCITMNKASGVDGIPVEQGSQGASRAAPGKSGLHARGEGERAGIWKVAQLSLGGG